MNNQPAGCEIDRPTGESCHVMAVGRCTICGRAFCRSHQARSRERYSSKEYVDHCLSCLNTLYTTVEAEKQALKEEILKAKAYLFGNVARDDIRRSNLPFASFYRIRKVTKRSFWKGEYQEDERELLAGWVLGEFDWNVGGKAHSIGKAYSTGTQQLYLTAVLDEPWNEDVSFIRHVSPQGEILDERIFGRTPPLGESLRDLWPDEWGLARYNFNVSQEEREEEERGYTLGFLIDFAQYLRQATKVAGPRV